MMKKVLVLLLFLVPALLQAEEAALSQNLVGQVKSAVFEVVKKKPVEDPLTYERELPLELLPYSYRMDRYESIGTAFKVDTNRFLTAAHVFALDAATLVPKIYLRDQTGVVYEVETVFKYSKSRDFVFFSVKDPPDVQGLQLQSEHELNEPVYSVGNAFGEGIVIRNGLLTSTTPEDNNGEWEWLRFSAATSPGNSGGPLVNSSGQVIGIISQKSENENLNYALPVSQYIDFPMNKAKVKQKQTYFLPHVVPHEYGMVRASFDLPLHYLELHELLVDKQKEEISTFIERLKRNNSNHIFPNAKGSDEILTDHYFYYFPGIIGEKDDYSCTVFSNSEVEEAKLENDGVLEYADLYGYTVFRLQIDDEEDPFEYWNDPRMHLEKILEGYPFNRSIANTNIRISSFGDPSSVEIYKDRYQRLWKVARFPIPFADSMLFIYSLLTPDGTISFSKLLKTHQLWEYESDLKELIDQLYFTYSASFPQWTRFLSHKDILPPGLQDFTIHFEEDELVSIRNDEIAVSYTEDVHAIDEDCTLILPMVYRRQDEKVSWEVGDIVIDTGNESDDYIRITKNVKPSDTLPEQYQEQWDRKLNKEGQYSGKAYQHEGWSYIFEVFLPGSPSAEGKDKYEHLYTLLYGSKGGEKFDELDEKTELISAGIDFLGPAYEKFSSDSPVSPRKLRRIEGYTFFQAILKEKHDIIETFLSEEIDINARSPEARTPLMLALKHEQTELAESLIEKGADVNAVSDNGWTPLMYSLRYSNGAHARLLIDKGAEVELSNENDWSQLMFALRYLEDPQIPRLMIDKGAHFRVANKDNVTPLMLALRNYHQAENARYLIEKGARINMVSSYSWTPLMYALRYGQNENAKLLIEMGADINVVNNHGWTPLMYALRYSQPKNATLLIEKGADVNHVKSNGWAPLMHALRYGQPWNAELMIKKGADVNIKNDNDWTPLMYALRYDHSEVAELLIKKGARVNTSNDNGWTPLLFAVRYEHSEIAKTLIYKGADVNAETDSGWTALEFARRYDQPEVEELLLEYGAEE